MAKKAVKRVRSYDAKADKPMAITPLEYAGLQDAFAFLNAALFDGELPANVFLTYQRRARSGGYFAPDRFAGRGRKFDHHEIALNPDGFVGRSDEFIVSILLHEMVHHWQWCFGKRPKRRYHDKEWSQKMQTLGLMPSSTGMVGGRVTGSSMLHYIIDGGPFRQAFAELAASGWKLNLESATPHPGEPRGPSSKTKFTCPSCGWNVWGKPDTGVFCKPCWLATDGRLIELRAGGVATVPAVESYEQVA